MNTQRITQNPCPTMRIDVESWADGGKVYIRIMDTDRATPASEIRNQFNQSQSINNSSDFYSLHHMCNAIRELNGSFDYQPRDEGGHQFTIALHIVAAA